MATLYITEFNAIPSATGNSIQIASQPPPASQTVAISGASAASSAFNANTNFVRIHTDAICSVSFGTAPTATTSLMRLPADSTEYFAVPYNQAYKVAVISNT